MDLKAVHIMMRLVVCAQVLNIHTMTCGMCHVASSCLALVCCAHRIACRFVCRIKSSGSWLFVPVPLREMQIIYYFTAALYPHCYTSAVSANDLFEG